jgi:hypothetical protein
MAATKARNVPVGLKLERYERQKASQWLGSTGTPSTLRCPALLLLLLCIVATLLPPRCTLFI